MMLIVNIKIYLSLYKKHSTQNMEWHRVFDDHFVSIGEWIGRWYTDHTFFLFFLFLLIFKPINQWMLNVLDRMEWLFFIYVFTVNKQYRQFNLALIFFVQCSILIEHSRCIRENKWILLRKTKVYIYTHIYIYL